MGYNVPGSGGAPRPAPKAAPPPKPSGGLFVGLGKAVGNAGRSVSQASHFASTPHNASQAGTDAQTSGPGYGSARANAFKQTPAYAKAVTDVFKAQPVKTRVAIMQNAVKTQHDPTRPESRIILNYMKGLSQDPVGFSLGADNSPGKNRSPFEALGINAAFKGINSLIDAIPVDKSGSGVGGGSLAAIAQDMGAQPGQIGKNALKDAANLPAEALPSVALPLGQALSGDPVGAAKTIGKGYIDALTHPVDHPLNAFLAVTGALHGLSRVADTGVRAAVGKPADLARPGIEVTGNLTHERPAYSKYPMIRASQKSYDNVTFKRNEQGQLTPASEAQRNRFINQGVSQQVGINERIRRANMELQQQAHAKSFIQGVKGKIVHGAKTALKYDPKPALIPGAEVAARVADSTIRRPDTFHADLEKHIAQISANRPHLLDEPHLLALHDARVAQMREALKVKAKDLPALFAASDRYARDTHATQDEAHALGHFGDMTKEALLRRELTPAVLTHMDGARIDPELGIVRDTPNGPHKLSTQEMQQFVKKENGGRAVAYTSHQPAKGDSAFYVSGQKRPIPVNQRNLGFAFTHGLTDPSHEALLEHRAHMQGIVDSHQSVNRLLELVGVKQPNGEAWGTYKDALKDAQRYNAQGEGKYVPIALARTFHPQESLKMALDGTHLSTMHDEALKHSLSMNERLQPSSDPGKYVLVHEQALKQLNKHEAQISPNELFRAARAMTTQFRKVALGTSARHIPGVASENLIRDITNGIGIHHALAARQAFRRAAEIDPTLARESKVSLTGGQAAGMTQALATRQVSRHFAGTHLEQPLKQMERFFRAPGPRQFKTAWNGYLHFTINSTKHYLEQNHQMAGVGKVLVRDFGRLGRLQGEALDKAARGLLDRKTVRQLRAENDRFFGKWTDQTPAVQSALMFSPFGMWWANSMKFIARLPIDHPVKTSALAAANTGTAPERQKLGLDMFSPNHLPPYLNGGIPLGNKIWGANYYSPFGVANDPIVTGQSLIMPWLQPFITAANAQGGNWLGKGISSPSNPRGDKVASLVDRGAVIARAALDSFVPLYLKASQIAEGGAKQYDTSLGLLHTQPKTADHGSFMRGLEKALIPIRLGKRPGGAQQGGAGTINLPGGGGNTYNLPNAGGNTYNLTGGSGNTYNLPGH